MALHEYVALLTAAKRAKVDADLGALLEARGVADVEGRVKRILEGHARATDHTDEIDETIARYLSGFDGLAITAEEVRENARPENRSAKK